MRHQGTDLYYPEAEWTALKEITAVLQAHPQESIRTAVEELVSHMCDGCKTLTLTEEALAAMERVTDLGGEAFKKAEEIFGVTLSEAELEGWKVFSEAPRLAFDGSHDTYMLVRYDMPTMAMSLSQAGVGAVPDDLPKVREFSVDLLNEHIGEGDMAVALGLTFLPDSVAPGSAPDIKGQGYSLYGITDRPSRGVLVLWGSEKKGPVGVWVIIPDREYEGQAGAEPKGEAAQWVDRCKEASRQAALYDMEDQGAPDGEFFQAG